MARVGRKRSGLKAVAVGAVLLVVATACSQGDAAQTAETQTSQAAPAPVAPAPPPPPPPPTLPPVAPSPYDFGAVSTLIDDAIAANELPGAVVQIGHGGQVVFRKAYGERKLDGEPGLNAVPAPAEPMTEDTIFDIASLTKPFATAPAIMQLFEQGKLQFDDPVQKYLPDFNTANDPLRAEVTLRMLLTHTSGLPGDVELKDPWGLAQIDRPEGFRRALTTPLESPPGAGVRYSDINFILLGLLVEKLTGETEDDYVQRNVFGPLGLTDTRYLPAAKACGPHGMRGAALAWAPPSGEGASVGCAARHVEHQPAVADRADGARRREQGGAGQESRHRLPAARHGERHDGAADGRCRRACGGVLDGARCRRLCAGGAGPAGGAARRVSAEAGDAGVDDEPAAAGAQRWPDRGGECGRAGGGSERNGPAAGGALSGDQGREPARVRVGYRHGPVDATGPGLPHRQLWPHGFHGHQRVDRPGLGYVCGSADEFNPHAGQPTGIEAAGRRRDGGGAGLGPLGFAVWADWTVFLVRLPVTDHTGNRGETSMSSERQIAREKARAVTEQEAEDARQLKEFEAFSKFSDDDLKRIVQASHRTSTSGPWPLIREQTVSDACYILLSGEAAVYVGNDKIATVGPGEVIGESALKRGKLRGATVTTTGRAEVLHIDRNDLDRLLEEVPAMRGLIEETVARRTPGANEG